MQIFYYNQSLRIFHLQEDYGSIDSPPDEMEDAGSLEEPVEYEEVENLLINDPPKIYVLFLVYVSLPSSTSF